MSEHYDAIVVGAGYGGVTTAAVLARAGKRILLLDKNRVAGGKAMSINRDGSRYELWPIAGGPAGRSRFHELVSLLGLKPRHRLLQPKVAAEFLYLAGNDDRRSLILPARPIYNPIKMGRRIGKLGLSPLKLSGLFAMLAAAVLWPPSRLHTLDNVSMASWIRAFRLPKPAHSFIATLMNLLFVVPLDRLSTAEALRTLRDFYLGGGGRYHSDGYGSIAEEAVKYLQRCGGQFVSGTRVKCIRVDEGGRVAGVVTETGQFDAPVVISNAGIQPTVLSLVGEEHFPNEYVQRVRTLEPSLAFVGVRYHLNSRIFKMPMTVAFSDESWWDTERYERARSGGWPDDPLLFVVVPSLYDATLVPDANHQVALIGTLCTPDPDSSMNDEAIRRVEEMALRLWPDIARHLSKREVFSAKHVSQASRDHVLPGQGGECVGLGQTIGQCGKSKPNARSPVAGLYFVGCDAGGYGCGTHQAVDSGFRVAQIIQRDTG